MNRFIYILGYPMGGANVKKHVLTGWNGIKIGLLAVSENWISSCSQLRTGEILYEDYIESARTAAIALKAQGAEIVLAITHNRLDNDYKLVNAVPEIDLLLGS